MNCSKEVLRSFEDILGKENVLSKPIDLELYSYDAAIDRAMPSAVVFPNSAQEISSVIKICNRNKIPFVARGGGTNLCGGTIPLHGAVVIAPTKMNRILSIDPEKRLVEVEPGLPNLYLKKALEPYGLFYAPDPASQKACTIGGNIGTNAGGPHCLKYGVTTNHVVALEVVMADGEIVHLDVNQPGYDLTGLFVGSEGTLGIATKATLNIVPIPERVETMLVSFSSLESAIQTVTDIISAGIIPATLEAMDRITIHAVEEFVHAGYPLDAEAVLLIEVDGGAEITDQVKEIKTICQKNGSKEFRLARDSEEREKLWEGRRGSYPAMAKLAPNVLIEDGAVPRNRLPEASKAIRKIAKERDVRVSLIFHAGDGNLHPQLLFDERNAEETHKVKAVGYEMLKACVDLGGTISGEHGIGMDKREAMRWLFHRNTLIQFRQIKNAFDPENLCNPDKLIPVVEGTAPENSGAGTSRIQAGQKGEIHTSGTESELSALLKERFKSKKQIVIRGKGSRFKREMGPDASVSTLGLNKILDHDFENFTVTVQAGMEIEALQKSLQLKNQKVFLNGPGTLGGALAANPNQAPRIRDQVLGIQVILFNGSSVTFGGKVVKNVAGYDAVKVFLGSWGTLGLISEVTLKTFPLNFEIKTSPMYPGAMEQNESQKKQVEFMRQKIKKTFDPAGVFPDLSQFIPGSV